jgi:tRNA 2-thiouridine synthesizing protein A
MSQMKYDFELDICGLNCPIPVIKTMNMLTKMKSGNVVKIIATDYDFGRDLASLSEQKNCTILGTEISKNETVFYLRRN